MTPLPAIRSARPDDAETLIALSKRTIRTRYPSFLGEDAVRQYIDSGAVEDYFQQNLARCSVVDEDGEIAGVGAYKAFSVDLMIIDTNRIGRGLGTRLLEHLEALLFGKSAELTLESFALNERANTFYLSRGWSEIDRYDEPEYGIPIILMGKRLAETTTQGSIAPAH